MVLAACGLRIRAPQRRDLCPRGVQVWPGPRSARHGAAIATQAHSLADTTHPRGEPPSRAREKGGPQVLKYCGGENGTWSILASMSGDLEVWFDEVAWFLGRVASGHRCGHSCAETRDWEERARILYAVMRRVVYEAPSVARAPPVRDIRKKHKRRRKRAP